MSLPVGFDARGLPAGVQLVGPRWHEGALLTAAEIIEAELT